MNIPETSALLAMVAASDRRTVGDIDVEVWHDALSDLPFGDCRDAVRAHIRSSREWLTPFDIRAGVKRIRADRLDRAPHLVPDADPDDPNAYRQALRDGRMRAADGALTARDMRAIEGAFRRPPTRALVDVARSSLPPRRPAATRTPSVDPEAMARARAEVAAREPVPTPDVTQEATT